MRRPRSRLLRALPLAVAIALVAGCGSAGAGTSSTSATSTVAAEESSATVDALAAADHVTPHDDAADLVWDEADEVAITLDGDTASADSSAVLVDGSTVTITAAGTYRLTGELTDGQVVVQTTDEGIVRLVLDGADLTSSTSAPLVVTEAEEVLVYLADGSANTLTDAVTYTYPDGTDEPDAALFSTADLTIAGSGSLTVTGNAADGIASKDGLVIVSGAITVEAADDGLRGKDYLVVRGGTLTVTAGGDGLKSTNADDASVGWVEVDGGALAVSAGADGVDAATDVVVTGGTTTVAAGDDALHADSAIEVSAGDLTLAAGDDGAHADAALTVSGGTLTVTDSYEGLESAVLTLSGGSIDLTASDDGINASSGSTADATATQPGGPGGGPGGGGGFADDGSWIYLSGATVVVTAAGDGLDSNGSIEMTGGTVVVSGPTEDNNGATDVNGTFTVSGGTLVAVGSSGMVEAPDDGTQAVLNVRFGSTQAAGTVVQVVTPDGDVVAAFESPKTFSSVLLSLPELVAGTSYSVYVGGTPTGEAVGYYTADGDLTGASDLGEVAAG